MRTLIEPNVGFAFPLPLMSLAKPKVCFPSRLFCIDHVRANVSSAWPVRMSSQSFVRVVEYESEVMGGNLSEARGIESDVAFFAREPDE
jgi:hypothetical protein